MNAMKIGLVAAGITAGMLVAGVAQAGPVFLTGHDASGNMPASVNWEAIATASPVIVMYMAVMNLAGIAEALIAGGRPPDDPVTIISNASLPQQEIAATTLAEAGRYTREKAPATPAVVVVGHASDWRDMLDWYRGILRENLIG